MRGRSHCEGRPAQFVRFGPPRGDPSCDGLREPSSPLTLGPPAEVFERRLLRSVGKEPLLVLCVACLAVLHLDLSGVACPLGPTRSERIKKVIKRKYTHPHRVKVVCRIRSIVTRRPEDLRARTLASVVRQP